MNEWVELSSAALPVTQLIESADEVSTKHISCSHLTYSLSLRQWTSSVCLNPFLSLFLYFSSIRFLLLLLLLLIRCIRQLDQQQQIGEQCAPVYACVWEGGIGLIGFVQSLTLSHSDHLSTFALAWLAGDHETSDGVCFLCSNERVAVSVCRRREYKNNSTTAAAAHWHFSRSFPSSLIWLRVLVLMVVVVEK